MKRLLTLFGFGLLMAETVVQSQETVSESEIEALAGESEEGLEDDSYLQTLHYLKRHPLNLNVATADELQALRLLAPIQIDALLSYRKLLGPLISVYELQAIPTWDLLTLHRLIPFVTVAEKVSLPELLLQRFKGGSHTLLLRNARVVQAQQGYEERGRARYLGSPDHLLFRYRYQFRNNLGAGLTADKDAGERLFRGAQAKGFDFYSAHLFARNIGVLKAVALGDYTINLGQGLIQWQSLAFKKGGDVVNLKRQSAALHPYTSVGEYNFYRGAALSIGKGAWEATLFGSNRAHSATLVKDTLGVGSAFSSISASGYHRTEGEIEKRKGVKETILGGALHLAFSSLRVGLNGLRYHYSKARQLENLPYNALSARGSNGYNLSLDYSVTYKNVHFFGEGATDGAGGKALTAGLLLAADTKADLAIGYRNISDRFHSFRGNAFTESAEPGNERGFYAGLALRPLYGLKLEAYADHYSFPFIRYRVDAPGRGQDYLLQITYQPRRGVELYARLRSERKHTNDVGASGALNPTVQIPRQSCRLHLAYRFTPAFLLKTRADLLWYDRKGASWEEGFLFYTEGSFALRKAITGNVRVQYFETGGFNSRIYAYESDVLYGYSIPPFFHKGVRYYGNISWDIGKGCTVWIKWAQTIYTDKNSIGSGGEEVEGNTKSEVKVQLRVELQ